MSFELDPITGQLRYSSTTSSLSGLPEQSNRGLLAAGARGLNELIEPIDLPRQVLFGMTAGILENDSTRSIATRVSDRLSRIDLQKTFGPGISAPTATGRELVELGILGEDLRDNERAQKWGGLALELAYDPLIATSILKVAGVGAKSGSALARAGNVAGKAEDILNPYTTLTAASKLVGSKVDNALLGGTIQNKYTPVIKSQVDKAVANILDSALYFDSRGNKFTVGQGLLLTPTTERRGRFARAGVIEGGGNLGIDNFQSTTNRDALFGAETFTKRQQINSKSKERYDEIAEKVAKGEDLVKGTPAKSWLQRNLNIASSLPRIEKDYTVGFTPRLQEEMTGASWNYLDDHSALGLEVALQTGPTNPNVGRGIAPTDSNRPTRVSLFENERANEVVQDAFDAQFINPRSDVAQFGRFKESAINDFYKSQERIAKVALDEGKKLGLDNPNKYSDDAVAKWRESTKLYAEANAMLAYEQLHYKTRKNFVLAKATETFGDEDIAQAMWLDVLGKGLVGEIDMSKNIFDDYPELEAAWKLRNVANPTQVFVDRATDAAEFNRVADNSTRRANIFTDGQKTQIAESTLTYGDFLGELSDLGLDINVGMSALRDGHMYRIYGALQDGQDVQRFVNKLEAGTVFTNSFVSDEFFGWFKNREGADKVGASIIEETFKSAAGERGTRLVSKQVILDQLETFGIKNSDKERLMADFVSELQGTQVFKEVLEDAVLQKVKLNNDSDLAQEVIRARNRGEVLPEGTSINSFNEDLRDTRESLQRFQATNRDDQLFTGRRFMSAEELTQMGEIADSGMSIMQQADKVQALNNRFEYTNWLRDSGLKNGYVLRTLRPGDKMNYTTIADKRYGSLKGLHVHNDVMEGLNKIVNVPDQTSSEARRTFSKLRSVITGGYLMKPSGWVTNLAGGLFSSGLAGVNMFDTAKEFFKLLPDHEKTLATNSELREFISVAGSNIISQDLKDLTKKTSKIKYDGKDISKLEKSLNALGEVMAKPFGEVTNDQLGTVGGKVRGTGNVVFGLEAYGHIDNVMKMAVYNVEKRKFHKMGKENYKQLAAEKARISTFDYGELPTLFEKARDTGLFMFPGFTYFMGARAAKGLFNQPALSATVDRLDPALSSLSFDSDAEQQTFYAGLDDWQKVNNFMAFDRNEEKGTVRGLSMTQFLPSNALSQGPVSSAQNIAQGGIWTPLAEASIALLSGNGEAPLTKKFGREVFPQGAKTFEERFMPFMNFVYQSYGASALKNLVNVDSDGNLTGLVGNAYKNLGTEIPDDVYEQVFSTREIRRKAVDRDSTDYAISLGFARSQTIGVSGSVRNYNRVRQNRQRELNERIRWLTGQRLEAVQNRDLRRVDNINEEIKRLNINFNAYWGQVTEASQQ